MSDVTRDGSPVDMYVRLGIFGKPEIVHEAIPAGAEILELGSGAGRMTHRLLELDHPVTAVDSVTLATRRSGTWSVFERHPLGTIAHDA